MKDDYATNSFYLILLELGSERVKFSSLQLEICELSGCRWMRVGRANLRLISEVFLVVSAGSACGGL